ncbi:hypothetical protein PsYK624_003260 [Phanerochaete sordida]|uniref:Uncharacterized protein n=1 Tax=Phanerochaete sordida TaxID=48140 RepID=A0A9P3L6V1_9APHY|nr:hypothetical protein PsYK624_003260 [Phanerochaete sordida]
MFRTSKSVASPQRLGRRPKQRPRAWAVGTATPPSASRNALSPLVVTSGTPDPLSLDLPRPGRVNCLGTE